MKLNIPAQTEPTSSSSPDNSRKLKKVLSDLPNTNMGELTKQAFQILRDQNRQTMPAKNRLENLEMLRVFSREIFDSLKKYFINRTLPLPEKSQKIVNLNQAILQEMIFGYEIIAHESANNIGKSADNKTLSTAICRAINYLSEMLLRSSEVYKPFPENLWYDAHQLYLFAENKKLIDIKVFDEETGSKTTIANSYKRILLFSLARPIALRQSDCNRVYNELYEWSKFADILQGAAEKSVDRVFCMRVFEDTAPDYLSENDLVDGVITRTLDASKLVTHVESLIVEKNKHRNKLAVGDDIPLETLMTLASIWGENAERRFSRAERHGHINVAIGLSKACKAIHESKKLQEPSATPDKSYLRSSSKRSSSKLENILIDSNHDFFKITGNSENEQNLTLESIADDKRQQGYMTTGDEENEWGMVAKGRVLTEAYEKEKQLIDEGQLEENRQNSDSYWEIVNISAGGYCLRWNSDDTSTAQIGELIALQEFDQKDTFSWRIGVIRWMQFTQESGLEIGVQILSPKAEAATAQRASRLDEAPFDCIMLPAIKALKQNASTILPAHAFNPDNKLVVKILDNLISVTLSEAMENTGSFTQFAYNSTELDKRLKRQLKKEEAIKNKDDFDELWSSL